ncbi:hypothetical protein ARMGADRAFT_1084600 [Armillaria gallica]|uniref:Uncharacterized protein n=1 Tax=Armillaria gallica TaxID=47427 RepID=A0A2H3DB52_ARMGA|nr:hypothetical protein ARMGADRAFT_1084600 [Armillaria gallica]
MTTDALEMLNILPFCVCASNPRVAIDADVRVPEEGLKETETIEKTATRFPPQPPTLLHWTAPQAQDLALQRRPSNSRKGGERCKILSSAYGDSGTFYGNVWTTQRKSMISERLPVPCRSIAATMSMQTWATSDFIIPAFPLSFFYGNRSRLTTPFLAASMRCAMFNAD